MWDIVNLTADAHPIHLHLVQFQLMRRQGFNKSSYLKAYAAAFPAGFDLVTKTTTAGGVFLPAYGPPKPYDFYTNPANLPDGTTPYLGGNPDITPFLQSPIMPPLLQEAGWMDNEMMRPTSVVKNPTASRTYNQGTDY